MYLLIVITNIKNNSNILFKLQTLIINYVGINNLYLSEIKINQYIFNKNKY